MDFIKCSKCQLIIRCCDKNIPMDRENENKEFCNKNCKFYNQKNIIKSLHFAKDGYGDEYSNVPVSWKMNKTNPMLPYDIKYEINSKYTPDKTIPTLDIKEIKEFPCPRCGKKMQEPRLLPCLHPICLTCVLSLRSKYTRRYGPRLRYDINNYYETCPLCDVELPNENSSIPPPHYLLQHHLVMNAIRSEFANKVLCDICTDEVIAVVQCSTCLRNFCLNCGVEHQQVTIDLKPSQHSIRPLWEATRVRRTVLCEEHPTHALRFYCIACQQVTCKECMWNVQHRGHASETATGACKRIAVHLKAILQQAKTLLNTLLTQYDQNIFLNDTFEEVGDAFVSMDYR